MQSQDCAGRRGRGGRRKADTIRGEAPTDWTRMTRKLPIEPWRLEETRRGTRAPSGRGTIRFLSSSVSNHPLGREKTTDKASVSDLAARLGMRPNRLPDGAVERFGVEGLLDERHIGASDDASLQLAHV